MNYLLALQEKALKFPFGKQIFSYMAAKKAPYFLTIKPTIEVLKTNYCKISVKKRKSIQNHIGTVHAIAVCNMCEMAMGMCVEASIPKEFRWIPAGMKIVYLKKSETDLSAVCDLKDVNWANTNILTCPIVVKDKNGQVVATAGIDVKVSRKKPK